MLYGFAGNLCGYDTGLEDRPVLYYTTFGSGICHTSCPSEESE